MAKKTASAGFREVISEILKGNYAPVYLLMGDEDYYIDKITEILENNVVPEEEKDFNSATYYGADVDVRQVISRAQQFPLMSDVQLVMLKEAQAMDKAKTRLEMLEPYVKHANDSTVLVITYKGDMLPATSKLVKAVQNERGVVFRSERLKDYQLPGPLQDYCKERKVKIDDKSVALLCEYIGSPLSKLFGEVDKLIVAAGPQGVISPDLIESIIGISKEYNSFELVKTISVRDFVKSMRILDYFSRNPKQNPGVMVLATLFNYFSKLFIAAVAKDKSDASLMAELDLKNSYSLTDYKNGLRNYKAGTIDAIIHAIRDTDLMSKGVGSNENEFDLLKDLLFKIFTLR
ncbi:MAG: DNA polymerase III subunit delta [Muribaculaceae bacterium]|nr:DNA polymerase III subunit delta [Muribaculaceae bacterium]